VDGNSQGSSWKSKAKATSTVATITCCTVHAGKPLELHCATCDKTICMECAAFDHRDGHTIVKIADLAAESREAIMHQVDCTASATHELGAAKVQLQACCGEVDATADASKQAIDAFAKRVRQVTTAAANAGKGKVDCLRGRKLGVGDANVYFSVAWFFKDSMCAIKCGSKLPTCRCLQTPNADSTLF
jgi:hypothetical protein